MTVQVVLPRREQRDLRQVLDDLAGAAPVLPFAEDRVAFAAELSRTLSRRGRGRPEIQALAFWMRKAELKRLADTFEQGQTSAVRIMPRGTVFHIPPANVDTLFVYSWMLSLLVGNRNIVRLSSRIAEGEDLILDAIQETLTAHPQVAQATVMLTYGHDAQITDEISSRCDTRVVWGGDETVRTIRSSPLPVHATELTFPDRFSMSAVGVDFYRALDDEQRDALAYDFYSDAYVFDQLACSSPRLVVWIGEVADEAEDFFGRVAKVAANRGYAVDARNSIAKVTEAYSAMIDLEVTGYERLDSAVTVLGVQDFPKVRGVFCGGGFFYQMAAPSLLDLVGHIERADQTLTVAGIDHASAREFVDALAGVGVDRVVPIGRALDFNRIWDGFDLLHEFTRRVVIDV